MFSAARTNATTNFMRDGLLSMSHVYITKLTYITCIFHITDNLCVSVFLVFFVKTKISDFKN